MKRVDKQVFGYCQRVTKPRVRVPQQESSEKSFKEIFFQLVKRFQTYLVIIITIVTKNIM